jgi:diguanylate cyclase (GGDEF)-like protein
LAIGLFGLTVIFAAKIVRDIAGVSSPFLDRWSFELGSIFDVFAFSLGVTLRSQYLLRERNRLQRDLTAATFDAAHDELTGLLNRRGLEARFSRAVSAASTVLFLDLDDFKLVNDSGGHAAGDATLRAVARILRTTVREDDITARVGGDELVIVLVARADPALAEDVIARISASIAGLRPLGPHNPLRIGVSIGRAFSQPPGTFEAAVSRADADAYRVKGEHYARLRARRSRPRETIGRAAGTVVNRNVP